MKRMNETALPKVFDFSTRGQAEMSREEEVSWLTRRLYDLGVLDMAPSTQKPPGFFVNWTTVTSLVVVVSAIVGLWYFTWQTAELRGIEKGKAEAERKALEDKMAFEKAEQQRKIDELNKEIRILQDKTGVK